jgi:NTE family protein
MNLLNLFRPSKQKVDTPEPGERRAVVALGGGGARGLAHLGVMQSIAESGIHAERIVGVSMGSLVGAMCASDTDINRVKARGMELLHSPVFKQKQEILFGAAPESGDENAGGIFSWYSRMRKYVQAHRKLTRGVTSPSLISDFALSESINYLVPDIDIQDLPVPLSIVAVDLLSGQRVVLEKGSLQKAVCASSAIPGIFPPVPWDDMLLADIGVIESVPTVVARMYASDLVIGVDVGQDPTKVESCDTALQVMMRIDDISEQLMRRHLIEAADLIVRPNVGGTPWYDFTKPEEMISEGRRSGHRALRRYNSRVAA